MDRKTVLVTGGTRGIGKAIALRFAREGYAVAICGRDKEKIDLLVQELNQIGVPHYVASCNVRELSSIKEFFSNVVEKLNGVDVLVNNAGIFIPGKIQEEDEETFTATMETNLNASYHFSRLAIPYLKQSSKGHLFNICSVASITPYINGGSYSISKYAQLGLTKVLREELKEDEVKVTAVLPGATLTNSWKGTELPASRFIDADSLASMVYSTYSLPREAVVEEILIRPMQGDID
ncbi:MAG: SDR family oxidoreductase [Bacteroidia bacterium]|nr:SDR family oxidoreductase [Bacteroidia bacterium]